jgi:hypothetical protein
MENQNIKRHKISAISKAKPLSAVKMMDGIRRVPKPQVLGPVLRQRVFADLSRGGVVSQSRSIFSKLSQVVPLALALLLAFGGGMWYALLTPQSAAQIEPPAPQVESATIAAPIPLAEVPAGVKQNAAISNDILFNTPIEMLKDYLATAAAQDQLEARKIKLHQFLSNRNSPLEAQADLIAEQAHWKLILAISFAESTLGQKCYAFNCSGIGGSQIRGYKSFDNWILDFNRLLEKRYKDRTLEQMCGVYVQPCNPNWLLATKQILSALDESHIE